MKKKNYNRTDLTNCNRPKGYYYISGKHSIVAAAMNPERQNSMFYGDKQFFTDNNLSDYGCEFIRSDDCFLCTKELLVEYTLDEILDHDKVILLDGLEDPRNIGSIIRTAAILNYRVLIRESRGCSINETVVKCASGGVDFTKIGYIKNLNENINKIKENGFWVIALAESGIKKIDLKKYNKILIVIGAEGDGVSKNVMNNSDLLYCLKYEQDFSTYNASVAAAIAMYTIGS